MTKGLIILVLLFPIVLYSQDTLQDRTKSSIVLKADIVIPIVSLFNIGNMLESSKPNFSFTIEKFIKKRSSLQLTMTQYWQKFRPVGYWSPDIVFSRQDKNLEFIPSFKFYVTKKKKQKGLYVGTYVRYLRCHTIEEEQGAYPWTNFYLEYIEHRIGLGVLTGYQLYIKDRFTTDFLIGVGCGQLIYLDRIREDNIHFIDSYSTYWEGLLAINLGYKININRKNKTK